eukprot:37982_1
MLTWLFVLYQLLCINAITFYIDTMTSGPKLIDEFLSVAIDARLEGNVFEFDFNSTIVNTLAFGLSPSYFRYGGTSQDMTIYDINGTITTYSETQQILNLTEFSLIADFAQRNKWKLIFGLNAQQRFQNNNSWNSTNSAELIDKIIESARDDLVIGYELGNEPDNYCRGASKGFVNVTPKQLSQDFITLHNLINNIYKNSSYTPIIWGCDIAYNFSYLQQFLQQYSNNNSILSAVTWHYYYGSGINWTVTDYLSIERMDHMISQINESLEIVHETLTNETFVILDETATAYNAKTSNLSSGFVAGFMYLDELGLSSSLGLHLVNRQDFWGGYIGLIGTNDFQPNPDYWSSYLFKNLIGSNVLYVEGQFENNRTVRLYAYCTRTKNENSVFDYNKGSVTILVLNLQNNTINLDLKLKGITLDSSMRYDEYLLTSYPNVIGSRDIFLNGNVIKMIDNKTFPELKPLSKNIGSNVMMEPLSYGFIVVANANVSVCVDTN